MAEPSKELAAAYKAAEKAYVNVTAARAVKNELQSKWDAAKQAIRAAAEPWDTARAKVKALEQNEHVGYYGGETEPQEGRH